MQPKRVDRNLKRIASAHTHTPIADGTGVECDILTRTPSRTTPHHFHFMRFFFVFCSLVAIFFFCQFGIVLGVCGCAHNIPISCCARFCSYLAQFYYTYDFRFFFLFFQVIIRRPTIRRGRCCCCRRAILVVFCIQSIVSCLYVYANDGNWRWFFFIRSPRFVSRINSLLLFFVLREQCGLLLAIHSAIPICTYSLCIYIKFHPTIGRTATRP